MSRPVYSLDLSPRENVPSNPARTTGKLIIESAVLAIFVYIIVVLAFS